MSILVFEVRHASLRENHKPHRGPEHCITRADLFFRSGAYKQFEVDTETVSPRYKRSVVLGDSHRSLTERIFYRLADDGIWRFCAETWLRTDISHYKRNLIVYDTQGGKHAYTCDLPIYPQIQQHIQYYHPECR